MGNYRAHSYVFSTSTSVSFQLLQRLTARQALFRTRTLGSSDSARLHRCICIRPFSVIPREHFAEFSHELGLSRGLFLVVKQGEGALLLRGLHLVLLAQPHSGHLLVPRARHDVPCRLQLLDAVTRPADLQKTTPKNKHTTVCTLTAQMSTNVVDNWRDAWCSAFARYHFQACGGATIDYTSE